MAAVAAGATALAWAAREIPASFGGDARRGGSAPRVVRSPQYDEAGGVFRNPPQPARPQLDEGLGGMRAALTELVLGKEQRRPTAPVPLVRDLVTVPAPADDLAVTWLGHSTALLEIEGQCVLIDPVWSERCSPSQAVGPRRVHPAPLALDELPSLEAVLISHDHYDHLDMHTVRELVRQQNAPFVVPLGVGAHLERWGVPAHRIIELDWHETAEVGGLRLTATPAHHFSGRGFRRDGTLWSSWAVLGREHRVFYSGDTGYFDGFTAVGEQYGPFDLTLVQIGAYSDHWRDIHMTPEEGVRTHLDVRGGLLVPVHWATFVLATHDWSEPVERLCDEADAQGVAVAVPRPGQRVVVTDPPKLDHWWRRIL